MNQVVIENPVLNSPFEEPKRHFKFTEDGITDEIIEERRVSQYFVPIPRAKKKSPKQLSYETEWTANRVEQNKDINRIRERVEIRRKGGYIGITKTTSRWSALYTNESIPFEKPSNQGKMAVKVINHYGDEVLKVYEV